MSVVFQALPADLQPVLQLLALEINGVFPGQDNPLVGQWLKDLQQTALARWQGCEPADIEDLKEARQLYHRTGTDPTRTRPSSEALLRRTLKGQELYRINTAVDICNGCSLELLLPLGLYDSEKLQGPIEVHLGLPGESYPGIRKDEVHLEGRLGLFDDRGPFGSPTSDSLRTSVSDQTRSLLLVIYSRVDRSRRGLEELGQYCAERFATLGGAAEIRAARVGDTVEPFRPLV
jgi:DNA/RNA-binding domain of Phe-tRNA-synthetase-like protein